MQEYRFRAVNARGRILRGAMAAAHEAQLAGRLAALGYELLSCKAPRRRAWRRAGTDYRQLMLLFTQLAALAEAGVPLTVCLDDALARMPDNDLRDALRAVLQDVRAGTDCAAACARHPRVFPRGCVAVLQAGMAGGDPALGFAKARDHAQWQMEFGALLRRATRYPLFLLALAAAVISFMMLLVVPQLVTFLQAQDFELPWHSAALIWVAERFGTLWWALPLAAAGAGAAVMIGRRRSAAFALWCDGVILRLPGLGALVMQREMAYFLHHLALLAGGGVAILPALTAAQAALQNRALRAQAQRMVAAVMAGRDLGTVWEELPAFGGLIARRAQIGLQTGTLPQQLQQASAECDAAVVTRSKQMIGALEPALTLLVGGMLAWIVLAVLGPLYGSLARLGTGP